MIEDNGAYLPGTVLEDRYLLGKIIRRNSESIIYRGYDRVLEQFVLLRQKCAVMGEQEFRQKARWFAFFGNNKNIIGV